MTAKRKRPLAPALPLDPIAREMLVPPPAVTNAPRWQASTPIPLLGGPIPTGTILIETQRNEGRANFTTLDGRRVCHYPLVGLTRVD